MESDALTHRFVALFLVFFIKGEIVQCNFSRVFESKSLFVQAIKEAGIDVEGFLTVGVSAALRQLLEFGLFHGDPHPGNIFAMRDGRIAYVDFGNVAVLSQV
jgi:tRNA A-37 threonylcarbamoyl transferase component Bud32